MKKEDKEENESLRTNQKQSEESKHEEPKQFIGKQRKRR